MPSDNNSRTVQGKPQNNKYETKTKITRYLASTKPDGPGASSNHVRTSFYMLSYNTYTCTHVCARIGNSSIIVFMKFTNASFVHFPNECTFPLFVYNGSIETIGDSIAMHTRLPKVCIGRCSFGSLMFSIHYIPLRLTASHCHSNAVTLFRKFRLNNILVVTVLTFFLHIIRAVS